MVVFRALAAAALAVALAAPARAQTFTWTGANNGNTTNPSEWGFGTGGVPYSSATGVLVLQNFGTTGPTYSNDLNLTVNTLSLANYASATFSAASLLAGDLAFAGAGQINLAGNGTFTVSQSLVLGSTATALTFGGSGGGVTTFSGTIASNTATGTAVTIATGYPSAAGGSVVLAGANTFAGGVVLASGNLNLTSTSALGIFGSTFGTLTVNGGSLQGSVTLVNPIVANNTLLVAGGTGAITIGAVSGLGLGGISGGGGLAVRPGGTGTNFQINVASPYSGPTVIGQALHAVLASPDNAAIFRLTAAGSILNTSSLSAQDGAIIEVNYNNTNSVNNPRLAAATPVNLTSAFVQVVNGSGGYVALPLGTVTAGGQATLLANVAATNASTAITIANLVRPTGTTVVFQGQVLGSLAAAPGAATQVGNIVLTQLNGGSPAAALVGGGGAAGSSTISVYPWALGDITSGGTNFGAGTTLATYDTNGVRALLTTEYDTSINTATATANVRPTAAATLAANNTVNAVVLPSGVGIAGAGQTLTVTSGAVLSVTAAAATISANLNLGTEGVISTVSGLATVNTAANTLTVSGNVTAGTLTKGSHGTLSLTGTGNSIGQLYIDGGFVSAPQFANLGLTSATNPITIASHAFRNFAGLVITGATADTLPNPIVLASGHAQIGSTAAAGVVTLSGVISGPGGLNPNSGMVILPNTNNTFQGGIRLGISGVTIAGDGSLGAATGPITINSVGTAGTIVLTGNWTTTRNIATESGLGTTTGGGFNTAGFNASWGGSLLGSATIYKVDTAGSPGVWTITGAGNTFTGTIALGTTVAPAGTLAFTTGDLNAASIAFGQSGGPGGTYVVDLSNASGTAAAGTNWRSFAAVNVTTGFNQAYTIQLGANAGAPVDVRIGAGTFGLTTGTGVIQGFGKLVKTGQGTLTLAGTTANTFTGGVEVWGGVLAINTDDKLGNAANTVTLTGGQSITTSSSTGATLQFSNSLAAFSRGIVLKNSPLPITNALGAAINVPSGTSSGITGTITGTGGFEVLGAGTLYLANAANTYTGNTRVGSTGVLSILADGSLGTGGAVVLGAAGSFGLESTATGPVTLTHPIQVTATSGGVGNYSTQPFTFGAPILTTSGTTLTLFTSAPNTVTLNADNRYLLGTLSVPGLYGVALGANGAFSRSTSVSFAPTAAATFDQSNLAREYGAFSLSTAGGTLALGASGGIAVGYNGGAFTVAGTVTGGAAAAILKVAGGATAVTGAINSGGSFQNLFGALSFGGATVATGSIALQNAFTLGGWADIANSGPTMTLDNTAGTANRIADTQAVYVNNSAIVLTSNATTASTETVGSIRGGGLTSVTFTTGGTLALSDATSGLARVNRGTFFFRGTNFGSGPASTTVGNLTTANSGSLGAIGGGGAAGSTTISIVPYITAGNSTASTGNTFVTYDASGFRQLDTNTEFASTFAGSTITTNVRTGAATTLAADALANSWIITGTANTGRFASTAAEKVVVGSGAVAVTVNQVYSNSNAYTAVTAGIQVAELQSGATNSQELLFHTLSANLAVGAKITTGGGLTKSGVGLLYLTNPANTYTGGTTVNGIGVIAGGALGELIIDSLGAINDSPTQPLTMSGGYLRYRGPNATLQGPVTAAGGSATNVGGIAGFHVVSGSTLTLGNAVGGFGGIEKEGTGTLVLAGSNTFTGDVFLQAGVLAFSSQAALGNGARFVQTSTNTLSTSGGVFRFDAPMTVAKDFATFTGTGSYGLSFDTNGNAVTISGLISSQASTRGLTKFGAGDLTLTAANIYQGATTVLGGNLVLAGPNGSILATNGSAGFATANTIVLNAGGGLVLDNTAAANSNRLPDVYSVPFGAGNTAGSQNIRNNGGEFKIVGNASAAVNEVVNLVSHTFGTVTLVNNGANVTLTSGQLSRTDNLSMLLIRGTNLGGTPGAATGTNWIATDLGGGSTTLGGAGGAVGTPFLNVIPGTLADTSATGSGTDIATYDGRVGFRPLAAAEYAAAVPSLNFDASRAPNVALAGSTALPNQTGWVTTLKLTGATVTGTATLNVLQSTILATGISSISVPAIVDTGNGGYGIFTPGAATNLTITSAIGAGKIYKSGEGTLALAGPFYGTGAVLAIQGTLQLSGPAAVLNPLNSVNVFKGATLDLGGFDRTINTLATVISVGTYGLNVVQDGTVALGSKTLTLFQANGNYSGNVAGTGSLTLGAISTGTFSLLQPNSYTGTTTVLGGTLQLASFGTLASAAIDVRGGTLLLQNSDDLAGPSGYVAQRVAATTPISLAGALTVTGNPNAVAVHAFGPLTLAGNGNVTVTPGANAPTTVTFANIARAATHGTMLLAGGTFGLPQAPNGNGRVFATQIDGTAPASALVGGGGADGSTTVSVVPWLNSGSAGLYTYGANGFRPLDATTEYAATVPAGVTAPTANVRTTAAATLAAATTINSLQQTTTGGVSGAFDLTITSGAFGTTATGTVGVNTNALLTGSGNTLDLAYFNSAASTLAYNVTTAGALAKYGSGTLTLTGTNTFAGGLSVNQGVVSFAANTALGAGTNGVTLGGATSGLTYTGTTSLVFNRPVALAGAGNTLTGVLNLIWQMNGTISGPGSLSLTVANAVYEPKGTNTYTGGTILSTGNLGVTADANLGAATAPLQLAGGTLVSVTSNQTLSRPVYVSAGSNIQTGIGNLTLSGPVFGSGAISKWGSDLLVFTATNPYTGVITMNAGGIRLFNQGALAGGSFTLGTGGSVVLDDSGTHFSDRLPDNSGTITMNNSGVLTLIGNPNVTTEENINSVALNVNSPGISLLTVKPGAGQAAILRMMGTVTKTTNSGVVFRGDNLGLNAPGTANTGTISVFSPVGSAALLSGGGGAAGTTYVSIVGGSFADTSSAGFGTQFVTYDMANGFRPLNPTTEFATAITNGTVNQDNIKLTGATATVANATTINALWLNGSAGVSGAGTLTLTSYAILATGTGNTISNPIAVSTSLSVGGSGDVTISSTLNLGTNVLNKAGTGTLTLTATNTIADVNILSGTVAFNVAGAFGSTGAIRFLGNGGAVQNVSGSPITVSKGLSLDGDMTVTGTPGNDIVFSGGVPLNSGSRMVTVGAGLNVTFSGVVSGNFATNSLIKAGQGTLILSNTANTYGTGGSFYNAATIVNGGELRVTNASGTATGGSYVVVNAGGTLSGTGFIVPAQTLEARNTVTVNAGGTITSTLGSGTGLTIGSAVTAGITTATVNVAPGGNLRFSYSGMPTAAAANSGGSLTPGTANTLLTVNGTLTFDPLGNVLIIGNAGDFVAGQTYSFKVGAATTLTLVNVTDQARFDTTNFTGYVPGTYSFSLSSSSNNLLLNFNTPVPEPAGLVLAGTAVLGAARLVRRRLRPAAR